MVTPLTMVIQLRGEILTNETRSTPTSRVSVGDTVLLPDDWSHRMGERENALDLFLDDGTHLRLRVTATSHTNCPGH